MLIQLHKAWVSFFEAMKQWREHPEKFLGRPKLPTYKHKEHGRNLLVYEFKAISKRALKRGMISLTGLGELVKTNQTREHLKQVRIVPRATQYVIEVVYERAEQKADLDPTLFASIDLGVNNLAALTSNAGITPLLINGRPLKSINQGYNKARAALQRRLAKENRFTSRRLEQLTEKRNRRVHHSLHVASRRIIDLLVEHKIATLIVGLNPLWKQEVNMGKRINQSFVQIPHARFVVMLTYKAALVGITVKVTEEAYTSKASFLDQDELPLYDPTRQEKPHFSGRRISRGMYQAADKRLINADINASLNIGRKVVPTAFAGRGIVASAVRPRRLAV